MTFTSEQFHDLASQYAELVVDGMDIKVREQFVYDTIMDSIVNDLMDMIETAFDSDILKEMVESVGVNPEEVIDI